MDTWLVCFGLADERQIGVALLIIPCLSNGYMACLCWFGRRQTDQCCTTYYTLSVKWIHGLFVLVWQTRDRSVLHYLFTLSVKWIHGLFVLVWQTTDRSVLHYLLYLVCQMDTWLVCVGLADERQIGVALLIYLVCQMDTWLVCVGLADDRQISVALLIIRCLSNGYMACLCWFGRRETDRCCTTYLPCLSNGYMACLCWFGRRETDRCCTTYYTLTVKWIHGLFVLVWQTTDRSVLHYLLYIVCQMDTWLVCVGLADERQIGVALLIIPCLSHAE